MDPRVERREERFWASVDKTDACWLWTGAIQWNGLGYGRLGWAPTNGTRLAHRYSYELANGPIPKGLVIDHLCRVPACVNPAHLAAVTQRENALRGEGLPARNLAKTHCKRGHPLAGDNLFLTELGNRGCRTCRANRSAAYRQRLKEATT